MRDDELDDGAVNQEPDGSTTGEPVGELTDADTASLDEAVGRDRPMETPAIIDLDAGSSDSPSDSAFVDADPPAADVIELETIEVGAIDVETIELGTAVPELGTEAARAVEAILMVADQPVEAGLLAQLLEISPTAVADLCDRLAESYRRDGKGFELVRVAGGYRFQSHADLAGYVERFALEGQVARLSGAALETLAIVAYKQPISRAQIAQIRGVNVDGVIRTLAMKGYIAEIGTDPGPGQAILFGTTPSFLAGLGIDSLADLASLGDFVPGPEIMEALEAGLRVDRTPDDAPPNGPASANDRAAGADTGADTGAAFADPTGVSDE